MKRPDDDELELGEAHGFVAVELEQRESAAGRVHAQGDVESGRLVIQRVEIGIGEQPVPLRAADEDAASAVLLGVPDFVQGLLHVQQRQDGRPAQPAPGLLADRRQPAIVAAAQRHLHLGPGSDRHEEDRRIEHLNVHAQLVHVLEPHRYVAQLTGCRRRIPAHVHGADVHPLVDEPVLVRRALL